VKKDTAAWLSKMNVSSAAQLVSTVLGAREGDSPG
jgi:hypothetical protein